MLLALLCQNQHQHSAPKIKMSAVETTRPTAPLVKSLSTIAIAEFSTVPPSSSVHSRRLPVARSGMSAAARRRSSASSAADSMIF